MGLLISKAFHNLGWGPTERRILLVGLDAAGKTTILFRLRLGETVVTIPTVGFNVEQVQYKNISFTMWDIGGQDKIRPLWRHYYENTDAVIFTVDSNDRERVDIARDELHKLLAQHELRDAALLVIANKQDIPHSLQPAELMEKLSLSSLRGRDWQLQPAVATTGAGLYEGLDWLADTLRRKK